MNEFPYNLTDDFKEIKSAEEYCPGVFYIVALRANKPIALDYYILREDNPVISNEAKAYGERLSHNNGVLVYTVLDSNGGKQIIEYEIQRYRAKNGLPALEGTDNIELATFGMENYPDYFGRFPAPYYTTHGRMLRYKALSDGIFIVEAEDFERLVAIVFPVWDGELSDEVKEHGEQLSRDENIDKTLGYLFFTEEAGCLALFELMRYHKEIETTPYIDRAALMNAVHKYHPEYAVSHSLREKSDNNDVAVRILIGEYAAPAGWEEGYIYLDTSAGTEYLKF